MIHEFRVNFALFINSKWHALKFIATLCLTPKSVTLNSSVMVYGAVLQRFFAENDSFRSRSSFAGFHSNGTGPWPELFSDYEVSAISIFFTAALSGLLTPWEVQKGPSVFPLKDWIPDDRVSIIHAVALCLSMVLVMDKCAIFILRNLCILCSYVNDVKVSNQIVRFVLAEM